MERHDTSRQKARRAACRPGSGGPTLIGPAAPAVSGAAGPAAPSGGQAVPSAGPAAPWRGLTRGQASGAALVSLCAGLVSFWLFACDSGTPPKAQENPFKPSIERSQAPAPKPAPPPPPPPSDPSELRKRQFTDADFVPGEDNRDPFEYNLKIFVTNVVVPKHCIAQRLSIDELKLVGIIAGVTNPTALFSDPGGGSIRVRVNDLVGRQCARVKRIIHEILPAGPEETKSHDVSRVIFEITEETGSAQPRLTEKTVWLNPQEAGK